jgi:hypothetical protein
MAGLHPSRGWRIVDKIRDGRRPEWKIIDERRFARYLSRLKSSGLDLRESLSRLTTVAPRIRGVAGARARLLLPSPVGLERARVVLIPMDYDSMVDGRTVYFDPLLVLMIGEAGVARFLSHEFHHIGRFLLTDENISGVSPRLDPRRLSWTGLIRFWASLLEMEGIADLVFDVCELKLPLYRRMMARRERVTASYGLHLRRAERILLNPPVGSRAERREIGRAMQVILRDGHPLGKRMAQTIQTEFGRRKLVQCVGRPDRFFRAYQDAAAASGRFQFSEKLLASIPS